MAKTLMVGPKPGTQGLGTGAAARASARARGPRPAARGPGPEPGALALKRGPKAQGLEVPACGSPYSGTGPPSKANLLRNAHGALSPRTEALGSGPRRPALNLGPGPRAPLLGAWPRAPGPGPQRVLRLGPRAFQH